ncbi:hypothetical protein [Providencia rettgeri]|uniref:hypothetical protein n=1 Tax=Providencia rettgeri TaxID=587 RepID=UPI00236054B9|nr:hypothetical protein [Providencia rettgeri]
MIRNCKILIFSTAILSAWAFNINLAYPAVVGNATLQLNGTLDMTVAERESHEVNGVLTGDLSMTATPIYSTGKASYWSSLTPFIGISNEVTKCNTTAFVIRPSTLVAYALPLTNNGNQTGKAYIVPKIHYEMTTVGNKWFEPYYSGTFYEKPPTGLSAIPDRITNSCFYAKDNFTTIPAGGTKNISISAESQQIIYADNDIAPGQFAYTSTLPLYITTAGRVDSAISSIKVDIRANLTVLRYCEVSSVTNTKIEHQFTNEMENIQNSTLTVQCNGSRQDVLNMVALAKETTYDAGEPTKLLLQPTDSAMKSDVLPWILGIIQPAGTSATLSCRDVGKDNLIHFDGQEKSIGIKIVPSKPMLLNIKWALCRTPEVKPGNYQGKTELSFFVKS